MWACPAARSISVVSQHAWCQYFARISKSHGAQAWECWTEHKIWYQEQKPKFGPDIEQRFQGASQLTQDQVCLAATRVGLGMLGSMLGPTFYSDARTG